MRAIFISYRRIDTGESGGHLYADLCRMFGEDAVFMDMQKGGIPWAADYQKALNDALQGCEALIVLIGRQWTTCKRSSGRRRLDEPDDWVRREIATVLKRGNQPLVAPVLLQGVDPPTPDQLPEELRTLNFHMRQGYPIAERTWEADMQRLVEALTVAPRLKELHNLATGERGIRMLERLIRENAQVADAVSRSRAVIETTDRGVDEIRLLKNIHDALHQVESQCLTPIRDELQRIQSSREIPAGQTVRISALGSSRRKFVQQYRDIHTSLRKLPAVLPDATVLLGMALPDHLIAAARAFRNVMKTRSVANFNNVVDALERLVGDIPVRLNDEIERAARLLELRQLLNLMTDVRSLLTPAATANSELKPMIAGIAALSDLRSDLTLRVRDHGLLQSLDNTLREMFGGQYRPGTSEHMDRASLAANWAAIRRSRKRFQAPFSPILKERQHDLEELEADIEATVARGDDAGAMDRLNNYCNEIGELFREVDSKLKEFCGELRERTRPLKTILEQCQPEPQHA